MVADVEGITEQAETLGANILTPRMQIMDAGWFAIVEGPAGAPLGFWQPWTHLGTDRVNEPGCFCLNELHTAALSTAGDFFANLLDWRYEENPGAPDPYVMIENENHQNGGILELSGDWEDVAPHWSVYFSVESAERSVERLEARGGTLRPGAFDTEVRGMAAVADPQGAVSHLIELDKNC